MYRNSFSFCIVFALLLNIAIATVDQAPSSYFSEADKALTQKNLLNLQKSDGTFLGLKNTFYAVNSLDKLKVEIPKKKEICDFAKGATVVTTEDAFFQLSTLEILKCDATPSDKAKGLIKNGLKSANLGDLYYAVVTAIPLQKKLEVTEKDIKDVVDRLLELQDDDGAFKPTSDDAASILYSGLALEALAQITKAIKPNKDEKQKLEEVLKNAGNVFSLGETEDNTFSFTDEESKASNLRVTATFFKGISALASVLEKSVAEAKEDVIVGITETLLRSKSSAVAEDINFFLEGVQAVASNTFAKPIVATLTQKTLKKGEGFVKVKVTDVLGNFASKAKVFLVKAYPSQQENNPLVSNQELFAVEGEKTLYQFNLLAAKPESGFYTLVLMITPEDKKFIGVNHVELSVKITGSATVSDVVLTVADSQDVADINEGRKYRPEFPKKVDEVVKVDGTQHVYVDYKVKGQTGKALQVQQAFIRISDRTGREGVYVSEYGQKGYNSHIDIKALGKQFYGQSGQFEVQLVVGDAFLQNPTLWHLGTLQISFPNETKAEVPKSPFEALPEIQHAFRRAEARPPKIISLAFTAAVIGVPVFLLLIGLLRVGASISLPGGSGFLWAVGFQGCLGAILALYGLYWLRLNMVQTLGYLGVLAIPTLFFAQRNFNYLAQSKQHAD